MPETEMGKRLWRFSGCSSATTASSVAQWFQWYNGVEVRPGQIQDDVNVIPGYSPLSIADAVELKNSYAGDEAPGGDWVAAAAISRDIVTVVLRLHRHGDAAMRDRRLDVVGRPADAGA
jgi:hypothetical protein